MMEESAEDIENPPPIAASKTNPHNNTPSNDPNKKIKIALLSIFLLTAIVLAISLGVSFQGNPSNNVEEVGEGEETPELDQTTPTVEAATYLVSPGPIPARIRMATPTIANGYKSCADLKDDILNALNHLANTIIVQQSRNGGWYEHHGCGRDDPVLILEDSLDDTISAAPQMGKVEAAATMDDSSAAAAAYSGFQSEAVAKEDSYETNNQVQGVDEADFVKSDGKHVFTAYGDVIFAWNAQDAEKGLSITRMPYNDTSDKDCPHFEPMPVDVIWGEDDVPSIEPLTEEVMTTNVVSPDAGATSSSGSPVRNRKASMIMPMPCYKPKPQILSLLLRGPRLTAIVSEESSHYYSPFGAETETSTLYDYQELTIKVYDAENVPLDGSPLILIGEKKIKGNYHDARSIDNHGIVITTSQVNTDSFTNELYRWRPQYCGMNSTEYEALAKVTALNKTESFMEKMMKDLELELDGNCEGIFQVASIQAGDSKEVYDSNLLDQFVRVIGFDMDMSTNQLANDFTTSSSGTFAAGWPDSIYVSEGFAGVVNVGHSFNPSKNSWEDSTFVSGFDISGEVPKPFAFARAPGRPLNKFATDLYDNHLRIATTTTDWTNTDSTTVNQIFVFEVPSEDQGREMKLVGETEHLGKKNERITAVRFKGDRAYVVTFEQIDPFYVVDLGKHSDPKVIGELEIPGFSQYLHELEIEGDSFMLGLGRQDNGIKIGLFNITDEKNPVQSAFHLEKQASSSAGTDSLAFRYLPISQLLIIPKSEWTWTEEGNFDGFVVYSINSTHITPVHEIQHADSRSIYRGCWYNAYLRPRSLVFQSKLTTLLSHSVLSTDLETGDTLFDLNLDRALNNTECHGYFYW
mmetsp:Transcript_23984/g.34283  ORF Transcript_23984/g.34283 Transcript_23984/m.34283 type:complete len:861 (-) Transcript_23984:86-2668(-)|eukprot:CAMPEP_0201703504 /NCGR_PEP_ID=MMETSP0578-20130828/39885_1 /ASSEMBLY_ACC=CAM_ASM_000663 /TAXON_ID=267565 /ORGANISM="Skeletonema grethea, Strain CCMP 1804" /LENGTH=860 /DNA_ID=CAMNT_0048191309 /DNA_START=119 /DNA_END=2698 /DNA_ORIENTATION=+